MNSSLLEGEYDFPYLRGLAKQKHAKAARGALRSYGEG